MTQLKVALVLASASPRRRELLSKLGVKFEVLVAPITEHEEATAEPRAMVLHNAALKAEWVCEQRPGALVLAADTTVALDNHVLNKPRDLAEARAMLKRLSGRTHTVYTGVCLWRRVGTPLRGVRSESFDDGRHPALRDPSSDQPDGRLGEASLPRSTVPQSNSPQFTVPESTSPEYDLQISHCETSSVTFRTLDDATITRYFEIVDPLDKAGAYGIQEGRDLILHQYSGSLSNIMGLPVEWLATQLHALALIPTPTPPIIADSRFHARAHPAADPPAHSA